MSDFETRYQPAVIDPPPLFAWPPKLLATLRWLIVDLFWPWGVLWFVMALCTWFFLLPDMTQMHSLEIEWVALIWFRNAALLTSVAGGLHWWYYIHEGQEGDTRFTSKWFSKNDSQFLWGDQVKDNLFWSLVSGVSIWTGFEAFTWWWYANGYVVYPTFSEKPVFFILMVWGVMFWSTFHFYFNHRLLHWKPLYDISHELHHRNSNTGPWTGISMHPIEHLVYFSMFLMFWVVPVHPVLILFAGFFQGIAPAVSHSGYDYLKLGSKSRISTGDNFHNLHHRYFHINYGNVMTPLDRFFNSWHDGSDRGRALLRERIRNRRAQVGRGSKRRGE